MMTVEDVERLLCSVDANDLQGTVNGLEKLAEFRNSERPLLDEES